MHGTDKLTLRKVLTRFSYGCGDFGCNIIYTAMSAFLMFYYTDYAGVSSAAVGVIMLISRVFDGVSDIIMGVIVDRTKSRFGKARPWLLRMCIPAFYCSPCRPAGHPLPNWSMCSLPITWYRPLFTPQSMFPTPRSTH